MHCDTKHLTTLGTGSQEHPEPEAETHTPAGGKMVIKNRLAVRSQLSMGKRWLHAYLSNAGKLVASRVTYAFLPKQMPGPLIIKTVTGSYTGREQRCHGPWILASLRDVEGSRGSKRCLGLEGK